MQKQQLRSHALYAFVLDNGIPLELESDELDKHVEWLIQQGLDDTESLVGLEYDDLRENTQWPVEVRLHIILPWLLRLHFCHPGSDFLEDDLEQRRLGGSLPEEGQEAKDRRSC